MVFCTIETGIFGLISEGQPINRIRQIKLKKPDFFKTFFCWKFSVANKFFMYEIFNVRKKDPVSANVKLTAFCM
jgi:hypothetical protein